MIKQKFSTPAQGARVQRSTQTKNGITLIVEPNNITVLVESKSKKFNNDFRNGVEL